MSKFMEIVRWYFKQRFLTKKAEEVIEVFDVVISSKQRLSMFDLSSGQDMLMNPIQTDYL